MKKVSKNEKSGTSKAKLDDKIGKDQKPDDKGAAARQTTAPGKGRSK